MSGEGAFEIPDVVIPDEVREIAEESVAQARAAYRQLMQAGEQSQSILARSCGELAASAVEIQSHAMLLADANIKSSLEAAARLAGAEDLGALVAIQSDYLALQMAEASRQALALGQMVAEALERSRV